MVTPITTNESGFGLRLHDLRQARRMTQLELAMEAQVSQRHLSFLEKGRSHPSRAMVLILADALHLPFRERNELLLAAGYAPLYEECALTAPEMAQVKRALNFILEKQEPYPAVVLDRYWNLLMSNRAAERFFGMMIEPSSLPAPPNLIRLMFDPDRLKPFVRNWPAVARNLIDRLHREAVGGMLDARSQSLLGEIEALTGSLTLSRQEPGEPAAPFLPVEFQVGEDLYSYFSAVTSLGGPHEVTAQELRIECFFPADQATEQAAKRLSEGG